MYVPKDLVFEEEGRKKLINGISKMASAVKSTLGPRGNTVLIESQTHTHGITVTKDGVTVAKAVDLVDPVENLAVKMMKEAADRTATSAGDGTTTAIVLTEALVKGGYEMINEDVNRIEVLRGINELTSRVVEDLKKKSKRVTKSKLYDVATISANNDKVIGKLIADVYNEIGRNSIVTVERSKVSDTYSVVTEGLRIARGYLSPLFINNFETDECVLEDVLVLVADVQITSILQLENVLRPALAEKKKILVIGNLTPQVVDTFASNFVKHGISVVAIQPPSFGYRQHELMHDIAVSVGATYFSEKTGDDLSLIGYEDLGHASKIIIRKDETILVNSNLRSDEEKIKERVEQLWGAHASTPKKSDKDFILERIASLSGGIGVIYVGGNTEIEQKELYDRVEDAVAAVRSALEEGILPGGGTALLSIDARGHISDAERTKEMEIAADILNKAMWTPAEQILTNAGVAISKIYPNNVVFGEGYNLKTNEYGNMIDMGVIDPLKVTRSALQNAVSVATTILSTNAIITEARTFEIKSV